MKPRLLILDDQAQYLRSFERALRAEFDVLMAENQHDAREELSQNISLVLTDIRLNESEINDREGLEFVRFVRSHNPLLPVIAMSALDDGDLERAALVAGADRFLRKPIVISELRKLLAELIGRGH